MTALRVPSPRQIAEEITRSNLSLERPTLTNRARRSARKRFKKTKREQ